MSTPSLLNIPYLYKAGTLYSQIPESGAGDFTVTRATTPTAGRSTRINKDGLIELVADNVPRLDYPLGGAVNGCPALLTETSAQNLALRSDEFRTIAEGGPSNSWTANDTVIISVNNLSPDGTNNATRIRGATTPTNRARQQIITGTSGVAYVGSAWIRRVSGTSPITLRVGDAGSTTNISPTSTWQRFSFSSTPTTTTVRIAFVFPNDTDEFEIWGAQLETGSVATSYIPTTTQAITRAADIVRRTGITSLIGQSEGTVYFEVEVTAEARDKWIFSLDSAASSFIQCWVSTSGQISVQIRNAASTVMTTLASSALSVGYHKMAFAYNTAANGCEMFIDGVQNPVASRTVTGVGLPAFNNFSYGGYLSSGSAALNGHVRQGEIYPNRLTNAQLAALTAP